MGAEHSYLRFLGNFEYALALSAIPMTTAKWDWESRIGRRVRLRDLHILSAVVRWGSMAKAAKRLAMSQSAVSEAIAGLEDALGVRLLERNAQGIEPTIYAEALLKRGDVVFDELRQGIKDIEFLADPTAGEIRVGCPEFLSVWLLPNVIDRFSKQCPQVTIRVFQPDTRTLEFRELHERSVDLMLARLPAGFAHEELEIEILSEDPHVVIAGNRSRWARQRKISLADLTNELWIVPPWVSVVTVLEEAFEAEGLSAPKERVVAASVYLRMHLVATGRFVTFFPEAGLRSIARQFAVKVLPIKLRVKSRPLAVVRLKKRMLSPVAQLFMEHLRAVVRST